MIGALFLLLVAYIMGSFPIGLWVGQFMFNKDIRAEGSGNIGATNAYRVLGPSAATLVLLGDLLKGAAPVIIMKSIKIPSNLVPWFMVAAGIMAIVGHTFSIFLKFKGGKGASTTVGVITVLFPKVVIFVIGIWLIMLGVSRYVSVSSMTAAILLPFLTITLQEPSIPLMSFSFLVAVLIVYKHRANIKRLVEGVEPKISINYRRDF